MHLFLLLSLAGTVPAPGGAVPAGQEPRVVASTPVSPPSGVMPLTITDAVQRGLNHNLRVLEAEQDQSRAEGTRRAALSALLPQAGVRISETRQTVNLEAFGFPLPGIAPLVGPFNLFDGRVSVSQSVFDAHRLNSARAESSNAAALRFAYKSTRDLVVLATANAYLQVIAASARADAARAERDTAEALHKQAQTLKESGLIAGIDVVRAEVRLSTERQRLTAADAAFRKAKLDLGRVIGLPATQRFTVQAVPFVAAPAVTPAQALSRAESARSDLKAAAARVQAAELERKAVLGEALPSVRVGGDYGPVGLSPATARTTYRAAAEVSIPVFQGGRVRGKLTEADADLRKRKAELDDLRASVGYDIEAAFLDLQSTEEQFQVATRGQALAELQLTQARDRFAAGVASGIEVVQAQEDVALAAERVIDSLYRFNAAKVVLAHVMGEGETSWSAFLGGQQ